ncbi:DUF1194 domain-containing protein [Roseomonas sp. NAR14]|uniref:DUF1194 domain-containing protein n=1 Tax=Roseomonas acroporae TaxID=2937791 RepID=A0A9X1Y7H6_9PROT|nr:DUF1194 domain-containing protein [Roseomonas acroporae]MCK8783650.1 DUF1194 domain-containing protein [Roseomonas acroporae]
MRPDREGAARGGRIGRRAVVAGAPLLAAGRTLAGPAAPGGAVDLLLVLAMDASGSIDDAEFRLQRQGYAEALTDPAVLAAIAGRPGGEPSGAIAVSVVEWGAPGGAATAVGWRRVGDAAEARALATALLAAPRSPQSYNAIGDAIDHAAASIRAAPFAASARIIDISGDGPDLRSLRPAAQARDAAVAEGITVNALAIGGEALAAHYRQAVIGGPGAFVLVAADRRDFARAIRAKLVREIAARPGAGAGGPAMPG